MVITDSRYYHKNITFLLKITANHMHYTFILYGCNIKKKNEIRIYQWKNDSFSMFVSIPDKAPSEAVFRGTEFLSYDLSKTGGEPIVSAQDSVTFYFKTRQPNGLLFYTGK